MYCCKAQVATLRAIGNKCWCLLMLVIRGGGECSGDIGKRELQSCVVVD